MSFSRRRPSGWRTRSPGPKVLPYYLTMRACLDAEVGVTAPWGSRSGNGTSLLLMLRIIAIRPDDGRFGRPDGEVMSVYTAITWPLRADSVSKALRRPCATVGSGWRDARGRRS